MMRFAISSVERDPYTTRRGGRLGFRGFLAVLSKIQRMVTVEPRGRNSGSVSRYSSCQLKSQSRMRSSQRARPLGSLADPWTSLSWLDPHKERRLTVVGSKRMVVFDDMQAREKLKVYDKGFERPPEYTSFGESLSVREGDIFVPRIPNVEPLTAELRHFVAVARGELVPKSSAEDGVAVVRVLSAASQSLSEGGKPVTLESTRKV